MTREYSVRNGVLRVPVFLNNEEKSLTVCSHAKVLFEITVGSPKGSEKPDRFVDLPVFCGEGEKLEISGDLPESFFDLIGTEGALLPVMNLSSRPKIHFTPEFGWMNDPNGLLFAGGVFHMYFQHNPLGLDWGNMSWGHTV
ncbi:MAG: hypothetical protein Q8878_06660, partial [Bacillota bacterium]|nr:hypothetical protein [Bacillota bacterium]